MHFRLTFDSVRLFTQLLCNAARLKLSIKFSGRSTLFYVMLIGKYYN